MPQTPESNKWTKLGPAVDFLVGGYACGYILCELFTLAFKELHGKLEQTAKIQTSSGEFTLELFQDVFWHAVQSKRIAAALRLLGNYDTMLHILFLGLVLEPMRSFMEWLIKASRGLKDATRTPPLLDLVNETHSPLLVLHQYYSALLAGNSERLCLIYMRFGCSSFAEWIRKHPKLAIFFRQMVLTADGWCDHKHSEEFRSFPLRAAILGDKRAPLGVRLSVAKQVCGPTCCLDDHFLTKLRIKFPTLTPRELLGRFFVEFFFLWAWEVMLAIAVVENRNARNKRTMDPHISAANFIARFLTREARTNMEQRTSGINLISKFLYPPAPTTPDAGTLLANSSSVATTLVARRMCTHVEAYMREQNCIAKALGKRAFPFNNKKFKRDCFESFIRLPDIERARFSDISDLSALTARKKRRLVTDAAPIPMERLRGDIAGGTDLSTATLPSPAHEYLIHARINSLDGWLAAPSGLELPSFGSAFLSPEPHAGPLHPDLLRSYSNNIPGKGNGARARFKAASCQFATGVMPSDPFPEAVHYPQCCPLAACEQRVSETYAQLRRAILGQIKEFRETLCKKPGDLPGYSVVIAFEVCTDNGTHMNFAAMPICSGSFGTHKDEFHFFLLNPSRSVEVGKYAGLRLIHARRQFVQPACEEFPELLGAECGKLDSYSETALVHELLDVGGIPFGRNVVSVRGLHLDHQPDGSLDAYLVSSVISECVDTTRARARPVAVGTPDEVDWGHCRAPDEEHNAKEPEAPINDGEFTEAEFLEATLGGSGLNLDVIADLLNEDPDPAEESHPWSDDEEELWSSTSARATSFNMRVFVLRPWGGGRGEGVLGPQLHAQANPNTFFQVDRRSRKQEISAGSACDRLGGVALNLFGLGFELRSTPLISARTDHNLGGGAGKYQEIADDEVDVTADLQFFDNRPILKPYDLGTIVKWGEHFSVERLCSGLDGSPALGADWKVWFDGKHVGTITQQAGRVLRGHCRCHTAKMIEQAKNDAPLVDVRATLALRGRCRISLSWIAGSTGKHSLMSLQATLFKWFLAGTALGPLEHMRLAKSVQASFSLRRDRARSGGA